MGGDSIILKVGFIVAVCALVLTGCARNISPGVYIEDQVGVTMETYAGVIIKARSVIVKGADSLDDNMLGVVAGGVAGGIVGSSVGGGTGKSIASAIGAIGGAFAGAKLEDRLKEQPAMEYIVKLKRGDTKVVVQGCKPELYVGQDVNLVISSNGRSRLIGNGFIPVINN